MHDCTDHEFPRFTSKRGCGFTVLETTPYGLAPPPGWRYTTRSKSKSFRLAATAPTHPLEKLQRGESVQIFMELPQQFRRPLKSSATKPIPVVLVPGPLFGSFAGAFLVAVVGRGSAVLLPYSTGNVASLVTAGMPSRLATYLVKEISNLVWSHHATRESSSRPRRSAGPSRATRRPPSSPCRQ